MIKQTAIAIIFTLAVFVAAMPQTAIAGSGGGQFFDDTLTDLQVNPAGKRHYYNRYKKKSKKKKRRKRSKKKTVTAVAAPVSTDGVNIQKALLAAGFYHGPLDGKLDSYESRVAVMQYQLNHGLPQTGELSSNLKKKLLQEIENAELLSHLHNTGETQNDKAIRLQSALKVQGFYFGAIDGDFGQKSQAAMRLYQQAKEMTPSGVLLPEQEQELVSASIQQIHKQQSPADSNQKLLDTHQPAQQTTPAQTPPPPAQIQPADDQMIAQDAIVEQQPTAQQQQIRSDTQGAVDSVAGAANIPAPVAENSNPIIENVLEKQVVEIATLTELTELKVDANVFSDSLAELPAGTQVTVNSIEGDWAHVSVDGQQGYVYAEYLATTNKE